MNYETLLYELDNHVVTLTCNRSDQHSAISRIMNRELHHAWQRLRDDDDAFVLVVTRTGETTFCAGWDLQDAAELEVLGDCDRYRRERHSLPGACGYTRKVDISMFMRRDKHTLAAAAFKAGNPKPDWPHHGL